MLGFSSIAGASIADDTGPTVWFAGVIEAGNAADAVNAANYTLQVITVSGNAADSVDVGPSTYFGNITDSGTASDTVTTNYSPLAAITEAGNAVDNIAYASSVFVGALTESGNAVDTIAYASSVFVGDLAEAGNATDTLTGSYSPALGVIGETGNATDAIGYGSNVFYGAVTETGNASDLVDIGPSTYVGLIGENGTATDAATGNYSLFAAITEAGNAVDAIAYAASVFHGAVTEAGNAGDIIAYGPSVLVGTISETGNAFDAIVEVDDTAPQVIVESGNASDAITYAASVFYGAVTEAGNASDTVEPVSSVFVGTLVETGIATDIIAYAASTFAGDITEAGNTTETVDATVYSALQLITETGAASDTVFFASSLFVGAILEVGSAADTADSTQSGQKYLVGASATGSVTGETTSIFASPDMGAIAINAIGSFIISQTDSVLGVSAISLFGLVTAEVDFLVDGQSATSGLGTLYDSMFALPISVSATSAVGIATFAYTFDLDGVAAFDAVGLFIPGVSSPSLDNNFATSAPGTLLDIETDETLGVSTDGAVGSLSTLFLIGVQGDSAIGTIGLPITSYSVAVTGVSAAGQINTETTFLTTDVVTGVVTISAPGSFAFTSDTTDTGVAALGGIASGVPTVAPDADGVDTVGAPGSLTDTQTLVLDSIFASSVGGIGVPDVRPDIIGVAVGGFVGSLTGIQSSVTTGVSSLGAVGLDTTDLSLVDTDVYGSGIFGLPFAEIDASSAGTGGSGFVGTLTNEVDATADMADATGAVGLLLGLQQTQLSGVATTTAVGLLIASVSGVPYGVETLGTVGLFTILSFAYPLGDFAEGDVGPAFAQVSATPDGVFATGFVKTPDFVLGQFATAMNGSVDTEVGDSASVSALGTIGVNTFILVVEGLYGVQSLALIGVPIPEVDQLASFTSATSAIGVFDQPLLVAQPQGVAGLSDLGIPTTDFLVFLDSVSATSAIGITAVSPSIGVSGQSAAGAVGLQTTEIDFETPIAVGTAISGIVYGFGTITPINVYAISHVDDQTITLDADDVEGQFGTAVVYIIEERVTLYQLLDIPWLEGDTADFVDYQIDFPIMDSLFGLGAVGQIDVTATLNGFSAAAVSGAFAEQIDVLSDWAEADGAIGDLVSLITLDIDASSIAAVGTIDIAPDVVSFMPDATAIFADGEISDFQIAITAESSDALFAFGAIGTIDDNVNIQGVRAYGRATYVKLTEIDIAPDMSLFALAQAADFAFDVDVTLDVSATFVAGAISVSTNDNTITFFMSGVYGSAVTNDVVAGLNAMDGFGYVVEAEADGEIGNFDFEIDTVVSISALGVALDLAVEIDIALDASLIAAYGLASIDPTFQPEIDVTGGVSADGEIGITTATQWLVNGVYGQSNCGSAGSVLTDLMPGQAAIAGIGLLMAQGSTLYYETTTSHLTGVMGSLIPVDLSVLQPSIATTMVGAPSFNVMQFVTVSGISAIATISGANLGVIDTSTIQAVFATSNLGLLAEPIVLGLVGSAAQIVLGLVIPKTDSTVSSLPLIAQIGVLTEPNQQTVSGVTGTTQVGALVTRLTTGLSNVYAAGQLGVVVPQVPSHTVQGQFVTGNIGALTSITAAMPLGLNTTGAVGGLAVNLYLVGVSSLAVESSVLSIVSDSLTAIPLTANFGNLQDVAKFGILGSQANGLIGVVQQTQTMKLGFASAIAVMGSPSPIDVISSASVSAEANIGSVTLAREAILNGISVLGQVGALSLSSPASLQAVTATVFSGNLAPVVSSLVFGAFGEADTGQVPDQAASVGLSQAAATMVAGIIQSRDGVLLSGVSSLAIVGLPTGPILALVGQMALATTGLIGDIVVVTQTGVFATAMTEVISLVGGQTTGRFATAMNGYFLPPLVAAYPVSVSATAVSGQISGYQLVFVQINASLPLPVVMAVINSEWQLGIFGTGSPLPAPMTNFMLSVGLRPIVPAGHPVSVYSMPQLVDVTYAVAGGYTDSYGRSQLSRKHR